MKITNYQNTDLVSAKATQQTARQSSTPTRHSTYYNRVLLMGKARAQMKPRSKRKQKKKLVETNARLVAENGLSMGQRSGQRRYNDAVLRGDVVTLTRSRDDAKRAVVVARQSKNKAMAAKREAEKAAQTARDDAEEQRRALCMATFSAEAEHAGRVRAEEEQRTAQKQLEEERERVRLLTKKMADLAVEKLEQEKKHQELARELGLQRRRRETPPPAPNANVRLRHQVIAEARRAVQRQRELDTMAKLVKSNANLRRQVIGER